MARIQRKKPASKTKKRQTEALGQGAEANAIEDGKSESSASVAAPAAEKKKKAYTVKKPAGSEQSAVMKLADKYFGNWIQFFREVRVELAKVTWPTKKQTIGSTAVVIVFVFVVAIFLGMVDIGLSNIIRLIL